MNHATTQFHDNGFRELRRIEKDAQRSATLNPKGFRLERKIIDLLKEVGLNDLEIETVIFYDHKPGDDIRTLTREESDRAFRLARIIQIAERVFGSHQKAFLWLRLPNEVLSMSTPIASLETETGSRVVEELLMRIDYGIAA